MSELKAGVIKTPHNEGMSFNRDSDHVAVTEDETEFYLKSEADKVISEWRNEADVYKEKYEKEYDIAVHNEKQLSVMRINLRHNKYKRCLAMAEMCGVAFDKWTMKKIEHLFLARIPLNITRKREGKCFII